MTVKHLDHLNMTVNNLDATSDWYKRVFGFALVESGERDGMRWGILKSGEAMLCIYESPDLIGPTKAWGDDNRGKLHLINHFGLRITDRKKWQEVLNREQDRGGLQLLYGGEIRYPKSTSWYVLDPTGYEIEVALWDHDVVAFQSEYAQARA